MDISSTLKGILIYDLEGNRLFSKVFDEVLNNRAFEKKLLSKTTRVCVGSGKRDEILILDNTLVLHKSVNELHFYTVGNKHENPLVLNSVLGCLVDTITSLVGGKTLEKLAFQQKLSLVVLAMDEICDNGLIIETDSNLVIQRVCLKDDASEQTMAQKLQNATEGFKFPWIRSYS